MNIIPIREYYTKIMPQFTKAIAILYHNRNIYSFLDKAVRVASGRSWKEMEGSGCKTRHIYTAEGLVNTPPYTYITNFPPHLPLIPTLPTLAISPLFCISIFPFLISYYNIPFYISRNLLPQAFVRILPTNKSHFYVPINAFYHTFFHIIMQFYDIIPT